MLISNEHFADSPAEAARAALADLAGAADEVHVVVTARDLGRVLPSAWQQRVKMGARQPYRKFLATVRRERRRPEVLALPGRARRSSSAGPPGSPGDRVHLVVVPPPGAPRDELWRAPASVLGVDVSRPRHRGRAAPTTPSASSRPSCCDGVNDARSPRASGRRR